VPEAAITLDDAARDFARVVARACDLHESLLITDHGRPVARLSPVEPPARTGAELAARLAQAPRLSPDNAATLEHELAEARTRLTPPRPAWD
jgi:prevent-host-death family protein